FHGPIDEKIALNGLKYTKNIIKKQTCNMLILDEITIAVAFHLLKKEEVITVLNNKPAQLTIVLTGRIADNEFISLADLVTNMKEVKHPYQKGEKPKPGFDY
ncbi:MAG: cob(I)yrinic acid a,c-diamide adenosyltransferase, partial [Candidatus Thermoplasmatota archaeon]|nr:cob(I)yrinic acid a,c-diamide adenosyltransferase [Candidatus Thermoplasmatota archaeon]